MKIALINPVTRRTQGYHTIGSFIPQLGLQVLADLVPDNHQVDIIDEIFGCEQTEKLLLANAYDLVGVTAYTSGATRAYEIAEFCRSNNISTIMGGPHASACPEEGSVYFDAVAIGECDEIWPSIIADAAAGKMQRRYEGTLSELETLRLGRARQGLEPINGKYSVSALQTSRGCPVGCEYCSVTRFNGAPIRRREISDIVEEWNKTPRKFIFVVDDNFFGVGERHAEWAKELLRALARHGKKRMWFSQTTLNMAEDPEGLRLAYQAGCRGMLIGFESLNEETLKEFHKGINRKNLTHYQSMVDGFHKSGIAVFGGFIIGAENDDIDTAANTALAAVQLGIDIIQITNLTPLPGTTMYDRYRASGMLRAENYPVDWERYTFTETVYNPRGMSADHLDGAIREIRYAAANTRWVHKRALRTLFRTRSLTTALFVLGMNRGWKRMAANQTQFDTERFGPAPDSSPRFTKVLDSFRMHLRSRYVPVVTPADTSDVHQTSLADLLPASVDGASVSLPIVESR